MKQDRIAKMYEGLSNKERAVLAFHYLAEMNQVEVGRIGESVPSHTYICKDDEFLRWYDSIFNMASLWAIEHWKAVALMMLVRASVQIELNEKNHDEVKRLLDEFKLREARLLAVDAAMLSVCEDHGIDPKGLQRIAGSGDTFASGFYCVADEPDADYLAEMKTNLGRLLDR